MKMILSKFQVLFGTVIIVQKVSAQGSNLYLPPEQNGYDYPQPPSQPNKPNGPGKPKPPSNDEVTI